ncbi:MAG: nickel-dependent lactate racemase [Dehalococcoidia bacterium]
MRVSLPFGRTQLDVELPDNARVLTPPPVEPLADPPAAVLAALHSPIAGPPLRERVQPGQRVAVVISDITRPVPNELLLTAVFAELEAAGIPEDDITIVTGTGLHRINTPEELVEMLGAEIAGRYRIVQHDARKAETCTVVGRTKSGAEAALCTAYVEADFRIVTGFVEPHLFAGFSGGAKGVMPGVAAARLIMHNHGAANLAHPRATWCSTQGNPVFQEMREITALCPPQFLLNVTLDVERRVTGVFAGDLIPAHDAAMAHSAAQYVVEIPSAYDVVVVTNMGYPADTTFYQSVKGMSCAGQAVRDGGAVILVAGCEEGIGGPEYIEFLTEGASIDALMRKIEAAPHARHDQWQIQCQAMVQAKAEVYLHSLLPQDITESAHVRYCNDVAATVQRLVAEAQERGRPGSVLVLPHGQLTVPHIR